MSLKYKRILEIANFRASPAEKRAKNDVGKIYKFLLFTGVSTGG